MDFSDRFTIEYSSLDPKTVDTVPEQQFQSLYPIFSEMVQSVKRHSVLLSKKSRSEIYYAITQHADPKIGLILAAARDNSGNQLFATTDIVKQFMFAKDTDQSQKSDVIFRDKMVFVDGIRRVSTALAASLLIGQLAQVPEQQKHSEYLEAQALTDLDRILQVPTLQDLLKSDTRSTEDTLIKSFYFTPGHHKLTTPVTLEIFISGANNWILVDSYLDELNTATITADIADAINSFTLTSQTSNLVAAPVLSGESALHRIDFSSRRRDLVVSTELISVRFTSTNNVIKIPFRWGVDTANLSDYYINSLILATQLGKVTSLGTATPDEDVKLNVLYFRQRNDITPTTDDIEYRISPTMDDSRFITIDPQYNPSDRANGAVTALLNDLFEEKDLNRVLGSIVQNDPNTNTLVYAGIHLVSYVINNRLTQFILDVLSLPEDLEVALGNKLGPITSFSSKPRSVTVEAYYERALADSVNPLDKFEGKSLIVKTKPASILQRMNDIKEAQYITYSPKQGYPIPPSVPDYYRHNPKNYL